jgi:hypothetical protein
MWSRRWVGLGVALLGGCSGRVVESTARTGNEGGAGGGNRIAGGDVVGSGGRGGLVFGYGGDETAGSGSLFGSGGSGGAPPRPDSGAVCTTTAFQAERLPIDMYIMFDQSTLMSDPLPDNSGTWWSAAQAAVTSFVNNRQAAGIGVGLQYFGLNRSTAGCTASSTALGDCCNPSVYETPEIEVGLLPGNATALTASIQSHAPSSFTPTGPALEGAILHMKAWAPSHLGRAPVVVLVTDGFPTTCASVTDVDNGAQIADLALLAKTAFETEPKVRTFVVGFDPGQGLSGLDQIAKAGGTNQMFTIGGDNISEAFINTMLNITDSPVPCSFDIPHPGGPSAVFDKDTVDVNFTPSVTGIREPIPRLNDLSACVLNRNEGWYYDSSAAPTKILICPGTCSRFAAGAVEVITGCPKIVPIP